MDKIKLKILKSIAKMSYKKLVFLYWFLIVIGISIVVGIIFFFLS